MDGRETTIQKTPKREEREKHPPPVTIIPAVSDPPVAIVPVVWDVPPTGRELDAILAENFPDMYPFYRVES